ncbi:Ubiquitinyl hydrolase 1 [Abeliophyllum distichum]|uniref:Ubiquitinyl hydrolase 1 n=1 Tax=Abeliophyllum distichum TaxID=126358 RepID=A0ABD1V5K9_9LAMI
MKNPIFYWSRKAKNQQWMQLKKHQFANQLGSVELGLRISQERNDLQELNLIECKAYLRRHGLRLSGTKAECIERIKEHWRIKDRDCEALYPRSSFTIDCTGDVCKGDVVLFNQKVYKNFDKMTRRGSPLGRRTVVGRIVKENYGAAKQQHTFTVEVLWSKGTKKLPPLFPLLVKGRNLYKLRTFRQRWNNEKKRLNVLGEKHKRGAAARSARAMRKTKVVKKTNKSHTNKGMKRHKPFHHAEPSGRKETGNMQMKHVNEPANALRGNQNSIYFHQSSSPFQALNSKQGGYFRGPEFKWKHRNLIQPNRVQETPFLPYTYNPSQDLHHFDSDLYNRRGNYQFPSHRGSVSAVGLPHFHPLSHSVLAPDSESKEFSHGRFKPV